MITCSRIVIDQKLNFISMKFEENNIFGAIRFQT